MRVVSGEWCLVGASAAQSAHRAIAAGAACAAVGTVFVAQIGRWGTLGFYVNPPQTQPRLTPPAKMCTPAPDPPPRPGAGLHALSGRAPCARRGPLSQPRPDSRSLMVTQPRHNRQAQITSTSHKQ